MSDYDFDIGIIGGGPAGSTIASYLAQAGLSCVVMESATFPRPHVGESLIPATTVVMDDIGVLKKVDSFGFPRKYGAAFTSPADEQYSTATVQDCRDAAASVLGDPADPLPTLGFERSGGLRVAEVKFREREQAGVHQEYTYHVDRGQFDLLLLQHAESLGAKVYEGVHVQHVDFSESRPRLNFTMGRQRMSVRARMVVDASGRNTVLGRQLKLKVPDPVFNQYATHTWFKGLDRNAVVPDKEHADFIFIHFLPMTDTWVWQIPINDDITSVGVVTQKSHFMTANQEWEDFFWKCVESRPKLADALRRSERVRPFKAEGDYSYSMKEITGDNWALIGDAARFVDPIFSSGVSVAMNAPGLPPTTYWRQPRKEASRSHPSRSSSPHCVLRCATGTSSSPSTTG